MFTRFFLLSHGVITHRGDRHTVRSDWKWIVQIIASIASAILTTLGATSCMGMSTL